MPLLATTPDMLAIRQMLLWQFQLIMAWAAACVVMKVPVQFVEIISVMSSTLCLSAGVV